MSELKPDYQKELSWYSENINQKSIFQTNLQKSIEGIDFKRSKGKSTLENLLINKRKSLKATVKALLEEIDIRKTLNHRLLDEIDENICRQHTFALRLEDRHAHYQFERFMENKNKKIEIENHVVDLEREKRKENVECWRDLMFLKKYLHMALKQYWDLVKRHEVLEANS